MNTSNVERTLSRPFVSWDVEAIVETRGGRGKSARDAGCEEEPES